MRLSLIASSAALLTGLLATGVAHADPRVQLQVTLETPVIRLGHLALPLPPVPVPRAVVVAPVYEQRGHGEARGYGEPRRWDVDGDGVPNRYDPRPYDPRNGRGWQARYERRDDCREDRREDRRGWRDEGHRH